MSVIQIIDKQFKPFLSIQEIDTAVSNIANKINQEFAHQKVLFVSILNGSFMFTSDLMKKITVDCEVSFVKISSYEGTTSTGEIKELIGLTQSLENWNVVILEDIIDTGNTLENLIPNLLVQKPKKLKICTLLFKPEAFKADFTIDYIGIEIPNKFIVGYGLDYNEAGRNLPNIYQIL